MTCVHLNQLYQLCRDSQLQLSSTDLIHIVCKQCQQAEVCPSVLYEEYDATIAQQSQANDEQLPSPRKAK
jgi:hypothetical protein